MIAEYHVRNSGMEQGVLLRRMRAINPHAQPYGTQYNHTDFNVGMNIEIAGVVYRIYACDQFTESYLECVGIPVGQFEQPPDDLYSIKRKLTERPIRVSKIDTDKSKLKQFLEFDGKVLRFYAIWDDSGNLFGEKRSFIIHYFLVDDTIEVRQILPQNSGRDPVSRFLTKAKLTNPVTGKLYTDADLKIGAVIDVFGRTFLIFDADQWTKDFLDRKYGKRDWTPIDAAPKAVRKTIEHKLPPPNGWGDDADSAGYCTSLHPKPPRKDMVKLVGRDGQILRFAATLRDPAPQDRARKFVIAFYLMDDTVAVYEVPQRNSGFREGKFIQRTKLKNVDAGRFFLPSDFKVGADVTLNCFKFHISEGDEYSLGLMEAENDDYPQSDLVEIVRKVKEDPRVVDKFRMQLEHLDQKQKGYVDQKVAQQMLMRLFGVPQHEALTVVRRWSNGWGFDYFSFLMALN
jgi:hypothetical protein